ncbi:glycosyltransferase family 4 protein [Moraxella nasicaprae]|uniref:Glycosyltransferase family 4 protein n=1 Tax=Moraxella nasicaprae TaxID=2904122 RepID=A0ABY6F3E5_9GAMM|nr:glycosyltransferase family 4 protein [Moraxella nasicaprae]UXZ04604.1 glycosyltransferase family 4 protein [Moraxella nasicaprae]
MKVLQLCSSLKHDESERGVYAISHALIKAGHESVVIASADEDDELVTRLIRDGADYYRLDMPKKSWWALRHIWALRRIINTHHPDVIHVHSRTPAWVLHWALRHINVEHRPKIVSSLYGFYPLNQYSKAIFDADVLICASQSIENYFLKKLTKKHDRQLVCVSRGVDVRKYPYRHHSSVYWLHQVFAQYPELEHKKWLLFPTPIGNQYGQEWLVDILGNLQHKFENIHIIIMDEDPENKQTQCVFYEEFLQRLHALNLDKRVTFIGRNPVDKKEWLASANVVLALANRPESIGMTALQAIHLGTPVIGWAKGAFADILSALFPQGLVKEQSAIALCKAIKFQLSNRIRPAMTHEYVVEQMVAETLAVYQSLCPYCKLVNKDKYDKLTVCLSKE